MERREFLLKSTAGVGLIVSKNMMAFSAQLPNVLIIGDSISIGYTPFVRELLKTRAKVFRPMIDENTPENCEGTTKGVQNIERWITGSGDENSGSRWDIIHFNFGLHDIKHVDPVTGENSNNPKHPLQADLKHYKKNLEFIVGKLKATGAKLIFATTTPYPDNVEGVLRDPGMPVKYNRAAIKIMNINNIIINDLYAFMLPRMSELQQPKNVHFTEDGYFALAQKVVERIIEVI